MELFIGISIALVCAVLGWAAWTCGNFVISKDKFDDEEKDFPWATYRKKNWDNWIFNGIVAAILMVVGLLKLDIEPLGIEGFHGWSDTYYFASGVAGEWLIVLIKKVTKK